MAHVLLTSNGFYTESIKEQFIKLIDRDELNACIITTASKQKERNQFAIKAREDLLQMGVSKVDFIDVDVDSPNLLRRYEVIYISGGNPFYLLSQLRSTGADEILQQMAMKDSIFVGVSAGALVLGPNIEVVHQFTPGLNQSNLKDFTALGIIEQQIFPHYDREDLFPDAGGKTIEQRLKEFERTTNTTILRLKDADFYYSKL